MMPEFNFMSKNDPSKTEYFACLGNDGIWTISWVGDWGQNSMKYITSTFKNILHNWEAKFLDGDNYFNLPKFEEQKDNFSTSHYDYNYKLTEQDIKNGYIRMDTYFVSKVWGIGSKDDSGALWHSLKTINRFGEKNSVEREIKALYNQSKALARIYGVNLE